MDQADELERLLKAHFATEEQRKRLAWVRPLLAALCTLVGAAVGAGWTARSYLDQIATKDHVAKLIAAQQSQVETLQKHDSEHGERIALAERTARDGVDAARDAHRRIDNILSGTTLPLSERHR